MQKNMIKLRSIVVSTIEILDYRDFTVLVPGNESRIHLPSELLRRDGEKGKGMEKTLYYKTLNPTRGKKNISSETSRLTHFLGVVVEGELSNMFSLLIFCPQMWPPKMTLPDTISL